MTRPRPTRAHRPGIAGCALMLCLLCVSTPATADPIGPHWGAAQILAEHPGTSEVLIASYERVRTEDASMRERIVLGIADDYAYSDDGSQRMIIDAQLGRIIVIDLASGSFRHDSIYAIARFLDYETWNRLMIGETLREIGATEGVPPSNFDAFWIESELGVAPEDQPRPKIDVAESGDGLAFSYGDSEVVTTTFSAETLSDAQANRFRSLLRLITEIHPDILEQIVEDGRLPETLGFRMPSQPETGMTTYKLQSVRTEKSRFPLAPDAERKFSGDHPFYAKVLPTLEAAVGGTWQPAPKSLDAYFTQIRDAVNRKAWFEAVMLQTELTLFTADMNGRCTEEFELSGRCIDLYDFAADMLRDKRVQSYIRAQEIQDSEPARAVEIWRSIPLADVPNPYLMGIFIGNVISAHSDAFETAPVDPYAMFATAIAANPYVSSFYKDIGDHFTRQLEFDLAWICYDLGRALPNRPQEDVLAQVEQIESHLRRHVPQLF